MNVTDAQTMLSSMMKSLDRKVTLTVDASTTSDRAGITVKLLRNRLSASLEISAADLAAAQSDVVRRHQVRLALKRAHDGMFQPDSHIFSTKLERPKAERGAGWAWQGGNRGRR